MARIRQLDSERQLLGRADALRAQSSRLAPLESFLTRTLSSDAGALERNRGAANLNVASSFDRQARGAHRQADLLDNVVARAGARSRIASHGDEAVRAQSLRDRLSLSSSLRKRQQMGQAAQQQVAGLDFQNALSKMNAESIRDSARQSLLGSLAGSVLNTMTQPKAPTGLPPTDRELVGGGFGSGTLPQDITLVDPNIQPIDIGGPRYA